mmetsp:Transcript_21678/g.49092  ORF Transcript_21678/g.49092 Transcript_21678/m.49092 type:complete len:105 (+) Transcript_21678:278-592(+)
MEVALLDQLIWTDGTLGFWRTSQGTALVLLLPLVGGVVRRGPDLSQSTIRMPIGGLLLHSLLKADSLGCSESLETTWEGIGEALRDKWDEAQLRYRGAHQLRQK